MLRTRVFNQPKTGPDRIYKNGLDALVKVLKNEGPHALFKGGFTHLDLSLLAKRKTATTADRSLKHCQRIYNNIC
jgi:hypothetical protein